MFDEYRLVDKEKNIAIEIGNDVWIGERVFLVGGIKINDGAVVLAGAVVTKDVPPYALMVGNPARQIGWVNAHGDKCASLEEAMGDC
jgi:acetyltransferase-like isoleucine patch superfamily enzyme